MAIEVIDQIARDEIVAHETAIDAHPQYLSAVVGATVFEAIDMRSPDGSVWRLTIDNEGILQAALISGPLP